jgi:dTDP-4-amino-4,6-dideoxygalactose transaminase
MFVGLGGNTGRLPQIAQLCAQKGLKLILDAAHMSGTRLNGRHVGPEADVAVFSFHAVKNLPTADAGMICFADIELDQSVRKWTWLGINKDTYTRTYGEGPQKWKYDVEHVGYKYHGNSIMAAVALVGLKYLDADNAYRRQISAWYDKLLSDCELIQRVPVAPGCDSSRHLYQVLVSNRDEVILALNAQQIFPGMHYLDNTQYRMFSYASGMCPNASNASNRLLSLPIHLRLSRGDVERVARSLIKIVEGNRR